MPSTVALGDEGKGPLPYGAVEGTPGIPPKRFRHRPGCLGKVKGHPRLQIVKIKAIEISNYFRKVLGWPLIEVEHHRHHGHHHHHHNGGKGGSEAPDRVHVEGGFITLSPDGSPSHHNHKYFHGNSFMSRLHYSLMNLGLWEGRAVAFVIGLFSISPLRNTTSRRTHFFTGCGIGVLLRMFWVLSIVGYRSLRGRNGDEYTPISTMEEYDSDDETVISVPSSKIEPPKYIYIVDAKEAIEGN